MNGQQWTETYGVNFDWSANGYQQDSDGWEHHAYTITLASEDKSVSFPWRQGMAVDDEPTPDRVLWAVAGDCRAGEDDFTEFAANFGYDDDSLSAYRTWEACKDMRAKLYDFASSQAMFDDFLSLEDES